MIKWLKPKAKNPNHELCDCTEKTQVDGQGKKYWPRDANGKPTGHHPTCEYYVPPLPPRP
jgi:hypothetical protein